MNSRFLHIVTLLLSFNSFAQVQNVSNLWMSSLEKGNKLYEGGLYSEALEQYLLSIDIDSADRVVFNDSVDYSIYLKIARCYSNLKDYKQAANYYEFPMDLATKDAIIRSDDMLNYAESLLSSGYRADAKKWFDRYFQSTKDQRGKNRSKGIDDWNSFTHSLYIDVRGLRMNSSQVEMGPIVYKDGLVYSSKSEAAKYVDNDYLMGEIVDFGLYYSKFDSAKSRFLPGNPIDIKGGLFNINSPAFFETNKVIISANKSSIGLKNDRRVNLKLYQGVVNSENEWEDFEEIPLDMEGSSLLSPSLSINGDTLYFASNQLYLSSNHKNESGGFDIYYSIRIDGEWTAPINMGEKINTSGDEVYPHIFNGTLYFASNGHPGLGGLDIYYVDKTTDEIVNVGGPINSNADDFGIFFLKDDDGFFASNREESLGKDDLFEFKIGKEEFAEHSFHVIKEWDDQPVNNAKVTISELGTTNTQVYYTDRNGNAFARLHKNATYAMVIERPGLITIRDTLNIGSEPVFPTYHMDQYFVLKAFVFSEDDNHTVSEPHVFVRNLKDNSRVEIKANDNGYFEVERLSGEEVAILIIKEGFLFHSDTIHFNQPEVTKTFSIHRVEPAETVTLRDLLYDLNQYQLKEHLIPTLDSVANNLVRFPDTRILIVSHTDSKGTDKYNMELSQKRAESVMKYLIERGINPAKIAAEGKGESELLNECSDGVQCSDEKHRINRRTEIKIFRDN